MIVWTIQPRCVYEQIQRSGSYTCDPHMIPLPEFSEHYEWMAERMTEKIGPAPDGVRYPVWAWYKQEGKNQKPDLRRERWSYGSGAEEYVCIELNIPDHHVVLSDFHSWNLVLMDALITETEMEDCNMQAEYEALPAEQQKSYLRENRERVFDISPLNNGWMIRGSWVQATFWELREELIQSVYPFRTAKRKEQREQK